MPKISVVMPVYNAEKYIAEAIQSILDQTEKDFELIIIDDGSTDGTAAIVNSFAQTDRRVRLEKVPHVGIVPALNHGLSVARGEYIARMDADDRALPNRLATQKAFLDRHPEIAVCGSWVFTIDQLGNRIGELTYTPQDTADLRHFILMHNPFIHPTVMYRKNIIDAVGGYRKFWKGTEDYDLWSRIIFRHGAANIPEKLLEYRIHSGQVTTSKRLEMRSYGILLRLLVLWRKITAAF